MTTPILIAAAVLAVVVWRALGGLDDIVITFDTEDD